MSRSIYKIFIRENVIAIFYDLEDALLFIKAICETNYEEIKMGINFTIKEELENE